MTSKYRKLNIFMGLFSFLLNIGPLAFYGILGFTQAELHEKITLGLTVIIVLIMTLIALVNRVAMRSRLWVLLCGLYICLDYILVPLIVFAVCQIVDELIASPLHHKFKNLYTIHREIDRRV